MEGQCSSGPESVLGINTTAECDYSRIQRLSCSSAVISPVSHCPVFLDGFTHWSLTGTLVADEDTFMGFNDGLAQSGTCTERQR